MAQRKRRIWLYVLLGVAIIAIAGAIASRSKGDEGLKVFTEDAAKRDIQETVTASGKVFPKLEVKISSDVSGEVVELYVEEGDSVVAGQVLAKIDPDAYQSQVERGAAGVNAAKAQQANSRAQIETLRAQKEQTIAQLENAREIHQRNEQLRKDGMISEADFQASQSNLRALEASIRAADANIRSAEETARSAGFNVQSSEATLNELRTSLRRTTIVAPMSGIISLLNVEKGERVVGTLQMTGTELMRIANLSNMEVRVEVSENDIPRVKLGDKAEVEIDAYLGRKFMGTVTQIANSSTTAALNANALTSDQVTNFEVRIQIDPDSYADLITPQKRYPFRPGMSASVEVFTRKESQAVSVPIQSVATRDKDKNKSGGAPQQGQPDANEEDLRQDLIEVVFVVEGDSVLQVPVVTGVQDDEYIQIVKGLNPGQKVVKGPYDAVARELEQGKKVSVTDEDTFYNEAKKD
jgi:HlyD family secretion protein